MEREKLRKLGIPLRDGRLERPTGEVTLKVTFFDARDKERFLTGSDGSKVPVGVPIKRLRSRLGGGDTGFIRDPFGGLHRVSIPPEIQDGRDVFARIAFTVAGP